MDAIPTGHPAECDNAMVSLLFTVQISLQVCEDRDNVPLLWRTSRTFENFMARTC